MFRRYAPVLLLAVAAGALAFTHTSSADDPPVPGKDTKPGAAPATATVKVEKGPLTAAVAFKGVVQAEKVTEVAVRLKAWAGPLTVKEVVEHGKPVSAGDLLVRFDTEKIDLALRDAKQDRELAELSIRQAELELPILDRQLPLDLAGAEREARQAKDDLKKFVEADRPLAAQNAEFQMKSAAFNLEFATEELKQLRKMYRDKDLTEETEELILKRYKFGLESAEFRLRQVKAQTEQTLKTDLPRREQNAKDAVEKAELALVRAKDVQPLVVRQKKLALAKLRYEDAKAKDRLADLEGDRAALTVKAATAGLAYHGRYARGQWTAPPAGLLPGGPAAPNDVILSVVTPGKLTVRAEAEEKELPGLKPGLAGRVTPTAFPDQRLTAKLDRAAVAPQGGKFELVIELTGDAPAGLVPGMTCSVRFVTVSKPTALTVPAAAVGEDDADGSRYVSRPVKGGKPERKAVKVGATVGDRVEILDGLAEGDEILAKP